MSQLEAALARLRPPSDPRTGLPAFGELPTVTQLDQVTWRVVAPNPSPMTLDGTNTYVVVDSGVAVVVDPGPDDEAHLGRVRELVERLEAEVAAVVTTHHHHDHAEAVQPWARGFAAAACATTSAVAGADGRVLRPGDRVAAGDVAIEAVATPGHCADHLAFRLPTGALLVGDHVLGRGTSVVAHPDGDLAAYLASLRRVLQLGPDTLYPGHGPQLDDDPSSVVTYYLDHRAFREEQILTVVGFGPVTVAEIVAHVYAAVDRALWPAAEASTRACLAKLAADGTVRLAGDVVRLDEAAEVEVEVEGGDRA